MLSIELVILLAMLGTFIALLIWAKFPGGLALMCASVVGWILSWIIQGTGLEVRLLVEGGFGYIDNLLVIICAMVFIKGLQSSGALDYLTCILVKVFKKIPTVLLLLFMALILLPGMVTGSSTAGVVSAGVIVAPIMLSMGMPKSKVAGFVALGAVLGMVAPPINIPVMVICDVVDIPYNGFDIPLLLLTIPMAVLGCIFFSRDVTFKKNEETAAMRKNNIENVILTVILVAVEALFAILYFINAAKFAAGDTSIKAATVTLYLVYLILFTVCISICLVLVWAFKPYCPSIDLEKLSGSVNFNITKELKPLCLIPLLVIVGLFAAQSIWPKVIGSLATPLLFIIAFIPTLFCGKKFNIFKSVDSAIDSSIGVLGLLMGVGMFIEVMTLSGARGYIVYNVLALMTTSKVLLFVAIAVSMTLFGGISSFASASIFGGPFVMALYGSYAFIIVASACSLIAALGEFFPPTAMSSRLAAKNINDMDDSDVLDYMTVTKKSAFPIAITLIWAMAFIIVVGKFYS